MAGRLLRRKVDYIAQTGATVIATGNPGCIAWIQRGLADRGLDIRVMHPVEILDAAYSTTG
jgi:glycolate oxidase iron-sulfur subunit